jgi:hypothetical protein
MRVWVVTMNKSFELFYNSIRRENGFLCVTISKRAEPPNQCPGWPGCDLQEDPCEYKCMDGKKPLRPYPRTYNDAFVDTLTRDVVMEGRHEWGLQQFVWFISIKLMHFWGNVASYSDLSKLTRGLPNVWIGSVAHGKNDALKMSHRDTIFKAFMIASAYFEWYEGDSSETVRAAKPLYVNEKARISTLKTLEPRRLAHILDSFPNTHPDFDKLCIFD